MTSFGESVKSPRSLTAALWVAFVLAGCGESVTPLPATRTEEKKDAQKISSPAAKIEVPSLFESQKDPYSYNPAGKRDPFVPFSGEFVNFTVVPKTPLEKYGLSELQLTGIIWGISDPRALIKAPDGYSYIVRTDAPIGRNRGRIARITRKEVYVEEEYRDPTGKSVVKESKFVLKPPPKPEEENAENLKIRDSDG